MTESTKACVALRGGREVDFMITPSQGKTDGQMELKETRFKAKKMVWFFKQQRDIQSTSSLKSFVGAKISASSRGDKSWKREIFLGYQAYKS